MKHPYRIREIAAQAGVSQATVDRVLHGRGGVRESTVREVHQAIAALDRRRGETPVPARVFAIDLVVRDRGRVEAALRAELGGLRPAVIRPRFHPADDPLAALARVARSRSQGVILQAAESPDVVEAVGRLEIPVVMLGGDLPASKRVAHVGLDERETGATAAYLVEQWLAGRSGAVLVVADDEMTTATGANRPANVMADGGTASGTATADGGVASANVTAGGGSASVNVTADGGSGPVNVVAQGQPVNSMAGGSASANLLADGGSARASAVTGDGGTPASAMADGGTAVRNAMAADRVTAGSAVSGTAVAAATVWARVAGFRAELRLRAPHRPVLVAGPATIRRELEAHPSVRAVYDPGSGGAAAVVEAFADLKRNYDVFVASELDDVTTELLCAGRLSAVLHHDLRADLRLACLAVLEALGALPGPARSAATSIQVITPLNIPAA